MQEYPKMLYRTADDYKTAPDKDAESQLRGQGYVDFAELGETPATGYGELTNAELQAALKNRGIEFLVKDTKDVLVQKLVDDDTTRLV